MNMPVVVPEQQLGPQLFRQATDAAGMCKQIVVQTAKTIQGRKFVPVEGWQAIAVAHGCVASAGSVEKVEGGFRAVGYIRRMDTGQEISTAEGFVGNDEPTWAKRPEYARRAMAQTRAISRACRSAFAHVVVMMNAGLSTTPAEEMEFEQPNRAAGGTHPPSGASSPAAVSAPDRTREETFKELTEQAYDDPKLESVKLLDTAGVQHPDEMSDADWDSLVAMLRRKITKRAAAQKGAK